MKSKRLLIIAGFFAATGVMLGAFASHGLKSILDAYLIEVFKTGVEYQFLHAFALIACGILLRLKLSDKAEKYFYRAGLCFIIGTLCFSGSLYALALSGIKWFGPITPFGGLLFIVGWVFFVLGAIKINEVSE